MISTQEKLICISIIAYAVLISKDIPATLTLPKHQTSSPTTTQLPVSAPCADEPVDNCI